MKYFEKLVELGKIEIKSGERFYKYLLPGSENFFGPCQD